MISDPGVDTVGFVERLFRAAIGHHWFLLAALLLVGVVFVLRRYAVPAAGSVRWLRWAGWFSTDAGVVVLAFLASFAGGLLDRAAGGAAFGWTTLRDAVVIAFVAMGGFSALRKIVIPALRWIVRKLKISTVPIALMLALLSAVACSWPTQQAARCDTAHMRYRIAGAVSYVGSGLSGSTALASSFADDEDVQRWVNVGVIVAAAVTIGAVFLRDDYRIAIDRECAASP